MRVGVRIRVLILFHLLKWRYLSGPQLAQLVGIQRSSIYGHLRKLMSWKLIGRARILDRPYYYLTPTGMEFVFDMFPALDELRAERPRVFPKRIKDFPEHLFMHHNAAFQTFLELDLRFKPYLLDYQLRRFPLFQKRGLPIPDIVYLEGKTPPGFWVTSGYVVAVEIERNKRNPRRIREILRRYMESGGIYQVALIICTKASVLRAYQRVLSALVKENPLYRVILLSPKQILKPPLVLQPTREETHKLHLELVSLLRAQDLQGIDTESDALMLLSGPAPKSVRLSPR